MKPLKLVGALIIILSIAAVVFVFVSGEKYTEPGVDEAILSGSELYFDQDSVRQSGIPDKNFKIAKKTGLSMLWYKKPTNTSCMIYDSTSKQVYALREQTTDSGKPFVTSTYYRNKTITRSDAASVLRDMCWK